MEQQNTYIGVVGGDGDRECVELMSLSLSLSLKKRKSSDLKWMDALLYVQYRSFTGTLWIEIYLSLSDVLSQPGYFGFKLHDKELQKKNDVKDIQHNITILSWTYMY